MFDRFNSQNKLIDKELKSLLNVMRRALTMFTLCTIIFLFFELKWNASFKCTYLLFVVRQLGFATLIVLRCGSVRLMANTRICLINNACTRLWFYQRTSLAHDDLCYRPKLSNCVFALTKWLGPLPLWSDVSKMVTLKPNTRTTMNDDFRITKTDIPKLTNFNSNKINMSILTRQAGFNWLNLVRLFR